jgi:DNA replicative helicase MCM subunit Mcm2 (Cdc46/Mcm family)
MASNKKKDIKPVFGANGILSIKGKELVLQSQFDFREVEGMLEAQQIRCDMCGKLTDMQGGYVFEVEVDNGLKRCNFVACCKKCQGDFVNPANKEEVEEYVNEKLSEGTFNLSSRHIFRYKML